jgi:hypothetical protein
VPEVLIVVVEEEVALVLNLDGLVVKTSVPAELRTTTGPQEF